MLPTMCLLFTSKFMTLQINGQNDHRSKKYRTKFNFTYFWKCFPIYWWGLEEYVGDSKDYWVSINGNIVRKNSYHTGAYKPQGGGLLKILPIKASKTIKKWNFGPKSGGLFKFCCTGGLIKSGGLYASIQYFWKQF